MNIGTLLGLANPETMKKHLEKLERLLEAVNKVEIAKLLKIVVKIENPEFKMGEFTIKGEVWTGILIRDKDKKG